MNYFIYNTATGFVKAKTDNQEIRDGYLAQDDGLASITSNSDAEHNEVKVVDGALVADTIQIAQAKADEVRAERLRLLHETDWWALSDRTMTQAETSYRQALRDVPGQSGFPQTVIWPEKP